MQRYNSFTMIHKALRAMLYDTALTLQQTYFADSAEAETALEKIENTLYLFEQHAHHEDTIILPAIALYEPQLVDDFEKERITDIELGHRLKHMVNIFRDTNQELDQLYCGSAINKSFIEFMVFHLKHMAKEEMLINQALWKHYTDDQLIMLNKILVSGIPQAEKALSAKWMMRGINNTEAINWLKAIRPTVSRFVFESLLSLTETELPEHRREKVLNAVLEPELAAF